MSDFKPMNECKGFNMERVLLKNKNGYMITAYFKDGMLQCDGDEDWTRPAVWDSFIRLRDLANGVDSKPANCAIFDVSSSRLLELEEENKKLKFIIENGLGSKDLKNDCP